MASTRAVAIAFDEERKRKTPASPFTRRPRKTLVEEISTEDDNTPMPNKLIVAPDFMNSGRPIAPPANIAQQEEVELNTITHDTGEESKLLLTHM